MATKKTEKKPYLIAENPYASNPMFDGLEVLPQAFGSVEEARAHIMAEAKEYCESDLYGLASSEDPSTLCSRYVILEVIEVVRPVPTFTVGVELKTL